MNKNGSCVLRTARFFVGVDPACRAGSAQLWPVLQLWPISQLWPVSDRATRPTEGLLSPGDLRLGVWAGLETRAELGGLTVVAGL